MILSVCLNPSIDMVTEMDSFHLNLINRTYNIKKVAGGKGNNTARIIKALGGGVSVLNMIGGYEGQFILDEFAKLGIPCFYSEIAGDNRRCLAILTSDGQATELREAGPEVTEKEYELLLKKFEEIGNKRRIITMAGSLPQKLDKNAYFDLINIAHKQNNKVLLDAKGEALKRAIRGKPFMIKINEEELCEFLEKDVTEESEYIEALRNLEDDGIEVAIVSLGSKGMLANWQGQMYKVNVPQVKVSSTAGSGDAVLGGLAFGLANDMKIKDILIMGAALGTAAAMEAATGRYDDKNYRWVKQRVEVLKI